MPGCARSCSRHQRRHLVLDMVCHETGDLCDALAGAHPEDDALLPAQVQRCRDAVYLCHDNALHERGAESVHRHGWHRGSIPLGAHHEPIHPACVAADESNRVHRQRHLHTLFPHRRGHAYQPATALPGRRHHLGGAGHGVLRHVRQGRGRLLGKHSLPPAAVVGPHDVRTDLGPRSRCHRHCHGGYAD